MRKIAGVLTFWALLQFVLWAGEPSLREAVAAFSSTGNVYRAYLFFQDFSPTTLSGDEYQLLLSLASSPVFEKPGVLTRVLKDRIEKLLSVNSKARLDFILQEARETKNPALQKEIAVILGKIPAGKPKKKYLNNYEFVWEDEIFQDERVISLLNLLRSSSDPGVKAEAEIALNRVLKTSE